MRTIGTTVKATGAGPWPSVEELRALVNLETLPPTADVVVTSDSGGQREQASWMATVTWEGVL